MSAVTARSGAEISRDIISEIRRNHLDDNSEIRVNVKDGTVTLSGTVDSYITSSNVEYIAYATPGVVAVDNQLSIVY